MQFGRHLTKKKDSCTGFYRRNARVGGRTVTLASGSGASLTIWTWIFYRNRGACWISALQDTLSPPSSCTMMAPSLSFSCSRSPV